MSDPHILIVDEHDAPIGSASKMQAQREGLIHRVVNLTVEDPKGRVLLQKRQNDRALFPGRWDTSVGGHVDAGEDYIDAAKREMFEEIGIRDVRLEELGTYRKDDQNEWRQLKRFYKHYRVVVSSNTAFVPDIEEVAVLKWFTRGEALHLVQNSPNDCTPGLVEAISRFYA